MSCGPEKDASVLNPKRWKISHVSEDLTGLDQDKSVLFCLFRTQLLHARALLLRFAFKLVRFESQECETATPRFMCLCRVCLALCQKLQSC